MRPAAGGTRLRPVAARARTRPAGRRAGTGRLATRRRRRIRRYIAERIVVIATRECIHGIARSLGARDCSPSAIPSVHIRCHVGSPKLIPLRGIIHCMPIRAASRQSLENSNHILEFDNPSMLFRMNTLLNTSCLLSTSAYPLLVNRYVHLIVCPLRGGNAGRRAGRGREAFRICNGKRSPPSVRRLHIVPVYGTVSGGVLILDAKLLHLIGGDEVGNHHRRLRRVGGIGNLRLKR